MCGVVSIVYGKTNPALGKEATFLLKKLEYRGYDSTGASFFREDGTILLKKKIGAPSIVTEELEIDKRVGVKFIGQVRWATYGSVTDENAQPHEVNCYLHMAGAHNGNVSNTDTLKEFLTENGHKVLSDNDGEMVVHMVEHFYHLLTSGKKSLTLDEKKVLFITSIRKAQKKIQGSYAACIATPDIPGVFAIKSGSSLYAGKGSDANGDFIVVSSDLTSVLSKTRFLIPLSEGNGIYFTENEYKVFSLSEEKEWIPGLKRSRLNISDISLQPKYHYFMEQEIHSSPANISTLVKYYIMRTGEKELHRIFENDYPICRQMLYDFIKLYDIFDRDKLKLELEKIINSVEFDRIHSLIVNSEKIDKTNYATTGFTSEDATLLNELLGLDENYSSKLHLLDQIITWKKKRTILTYKNELLRIFNEAKVRGTRVFVVASGTSYHAALVSGYFFSKIAGFSIIPVNPGDFRSLYISSLRKSDLIVGVSQSGETKDLVDIFNEVRANYGSDLKIIAVVNNENSTIPQEKADFYLPVLCGSEIAVAATKSFISQIALFYLLAESMVEDETSVRHKMENIKQYMTFTLKNAEEELMDVVSRLFMKPSMHILGTSLIGLAKEGALKVREVVLNHTEGYDSSEFKHGPNTILGKNTIFDLSTLENLLSDLFDYFQRLRSENFTDKENLLKFIDFIKSFKFSDFGNDLLRPFYSDNEEKELFERVSSDYKKSISIENYFTHYPLIFVCPPVERDKRITISQIHTHKIRGADIILIAEEDEELRKAVEGVPAGNEQYYSRYIVLPATGNKDVFVFEAALILQLLAFKMSVAKRKYLNRNHVENHGVHPDVPKNVSKSITVD